MPPIETPLNAANQHAANADDHIAQGLLIPAAEEHHKAAEAYAAAMERCSEDHTKRTLKMLHNDHLKAGKELQRRIQKLREENKDPSLPQKPSPSLSSSNTNPVTQIPQPVPSPPPSGRRMTDSQNTGEESFMVLGQRSDPGDAFNQFWKILEGMLDNLSQPVAFATAPLAADDLQPSSAALQRNGSISSDTDIEEPMVRRITRRMGIGKDSSKVKKSSGLSKSETPSSVNFDDEEFDEEDFLNGDDLSESFCVVPAGPEATSAALRKENTVLKTDMEAMQKRLAAAERVLQLRKDQDQQLRDSIFMVRREAQRAMGQSGIIQARAGQGAMDFGNLNIPPAHSPIPPLNGGRDNEAQLLRRVRELEEESRLLRADNEKLKAHVAKYRERWDKVKESQRRKKAAVVSAASTSVRETISEEPEKEEDTGVVAVKEMVTNDV